MAIRLGTPGPRGPQKRRNTPTASPPKVGTTTTGQRASQSGAAGPAGGRGAGAGAGGVPVRKPMLPRPSCSRALSGVAPSWAGGGGRVTGATGAWAWAATATGERLISSSPSTKGPKR